HSGRFHQPAVHLNAGVAFVADLLDLAKLDLVHERLVDACNLSLASALINDKYLSGTGGGAGGEGDSAVLCKGERLDVTGFAGLDGVLAAEWEFVDMGAAGVADEAEHALPVIAPGWHSAGNTVARIGDGRVARLTV